MDCIAGASWSVDRYPGFDSTLGKPGRGVDQVASP